MLYEFLMDEIIILEFNFVIHNFNARGKFFPA